MKPACNNNLKENKIADIPAVIKTLKHHKTLKHIFTDPVVPVYQADREALIEIEASLGRPIYILSEEIHKTKGVGIRVHEERIVGLAATEDCIPK